MDTSKLLPWVAKTLDVANTGDNPVNRGQCVGLVEAWLDVLGKPHIPGNAKDLLDGADHKVYKVTANLPSNFPQPGAIIVWGGSWGGGYGHTAVVLAANVNHVVTFEQNDPTGSPPLVATHNYSGVIGWISW